MCKYYSLLFALLFSPTLSKSQSLPPERRSDWPTAGRQQAIPDYDKVINILDFGGSGDSVILNEIPFQHAVSSLEGKSGVIFFPAGKYLFHNPLVLRDSLIVRGEGAMLTALYFDLGGVQRDCIVSSGVIVPDIDAVLLTQSAMYGDTILYAVTDFQPGDFVRLQFDDSLLVFSGWARGTVGQLFDVIAVENDEIIVNHPLRVDCDSALRPRLRKIDPVEDAGLECLKIKRLDTNVSQGSNIYFEYSRRCWITGVESELCNFSHVNFENSAHCEMYGCYAHDAFEYGGGGQGYGLVVEHTSCDNRAQNNIFQHLRHSMLLQSGANGNVLGYNFSTDAFWNEFPNDAAGDIVLHGNYPSYNLFEGNVCETIRPDDSHGNNGPYNTLFRNRATNYGLIITEPNYQHALNIMGNEILPGGFLHGLYIVSGTDHLEQGNSQNGTIIPIGTPVQTDTSLYLNTLPSFLSGTNFLIGPPSAFNTASIPAKDRYFSGNEKTDCEASAGLMVDYFAPPIPTVEMDIFPNPAGASFSVFLEMTGSVEIFDLTGKQQYSAISNDGKLHIECGIWAAGLYIIKARIGQKMCVKMLCKLP